MLTFVVVLTSLFVIFLLFVLESQWTRDFWYNWSKNFKTPSKERIVPKRSANTLLIENNEVLKTNYYAPQSHISPRDWNYTASSFSPSSFTNILRENQYYNDKQLHSGVSAYCPEPTFVKNQRLKGEQLNAIIKEKKIKEVPPDLVRKASEKYWNKTSPASAQNMKDEAVYPTVIPSVVIKKLTKKEEQKKDTHKDKTIGGLKKGGFTLPSKPIITKTDSTGDEPKEKPKIGTGLKLNLLKK